MDSERVQIIINVVRFGRKQQLLYRAIGTAKIVLTRQINFRTLFKSTRSLYVDHFFLSLNLFLAGLAPELVRNRIFGRHRRFRIMRFDHYSIKL